MLGLYGLAIYLGVAIIGAGIIALLVVVALAVGLVTHPIRTLAWCSTSSPLSPPASH